MSNPALNKAFGTPVAESAAQNQKYYGEQPYAQQYGMPTPSADQLQQQYNQPAAHPADMGRMTMDDVIVRSAMTLGTVIVTAGIAWWLGMSNYALVTPMMIGGMVIGLVLGLVNSFKKEPSPALILAYAVAEGFMLGALSMVLEVVVGYDGIVLQAVLATFVTALVTLGVYKSGLVKVTSKFIKFVTIAMLAYLGFALVNLVLMWTNVAPGMFGLRSGGLGLAIGAVAVLLATFSLMIDFKQIEDGIRTGVPRKYAWSAAFGLTVTLIWLYVEILRILAILRGD
ncbi:Uncharacterized membrane protein, YccA/Bax inhibitor family [Ruaniaceae bacterium KH17]|nr:Uncharacterized membrane protein, YccA/Bax inhibitor family [Ruaniaceae bacterium KH17]